MDDIKVCGVIRDSGACGLYRITQPLKFLAEEEGMDVAIGGVEFKSVEFKTDLFNLLQECDVAIIPRVVSEKTLQLIKVLKDMSPRKKVIIDYDDNIFEVTPFSTHYRDFGTREVSHNNIKIWQDGKDLFDIQRNIDNLNLAKEALRIVDGVFVTTPILADVYSKYNKNIYTLPNSLDFNIWKPSNLVKDDKVRITWHGGSSHYEDLHEIGGELTNITNKHKNVKIVTCGHEFKGVFKNIPSDQYEHHGWVDVLAHPYKQILLNADLAVIPLKDHKFNYSKSPIKWIEYSSLGIPCVLKDIHPYSNLVIHGITGFLYKTTEECEFWMDKLVEHPSLRKRIGDAAKEYVHEHFDAKKNSKYWSEAIKTIMEEKCLSLQ